MKDKVVIVTGAAGFLGTAVIEKFVSENANLVLLDKNCERALLTIKTLKYPKEKYLVEEANVLDADLIQTIIRKVIKKYQKIDSLIHIAGTYRGGTPVYETDLKTWDFLLNLNAKSLIVMVKAVVPLMIAQGTGSIITIGSRNVEQISINNGPYTASKSAMIKLSQTMAQELLHKGIRVNSVLPSILDTPPNRKLMPGSSFDDWVQPSSVADVIFFLASHQGRDISGATIPVYGKV